MFSPLVFNYAWFNANYKASRSEAEAKKQWLDELKGVSYPNCKQASQDFSPNAYYRANKATFRMTGGNCGAIVSHFLETGVYNAARTYDAKQEQIARRSLSSQQSRVSRLQGDTAAILLKTDEGKSQFRLNTVSGQLRGASDIGTPLGADGAAQYSYAFYMKQGEKSPVKTSVFHYGANKILQPGVWQRGNRWEAQVSTTEDPRFSCLSPRPLSKLKWSYLALVVSPSGVKLYHNGELAKSCPFKANARATLLRKTDLVAPGGQGPISFGGFGDGTDAEIKSLYYYPGGTLTTELLRAQMTLHSFRSQEALAISERAQEGKSKVTALKSLDEFDTDLMREEAEMSEQMNRDMLAE